MKLDTLNIFIELAQKKGDRKIAVAAAEDRPVLEAVAEAKRMGIAEPVLIGDTAKIKEIADAIKFDLAGIEMIEENSPAKSCRSAVRIIRENKAHILMKGMVGTADYLRAVLDKENGLRAGSLLSHIGFFEAKNYHKLIAVTDAAQNIAPDFQEKLSILKNAVGMLNKIGLSLPKVAVLAAVETVNPKMEATTHAALMTMMNRRKQIKGCLIDGPLALDNAISKEAAEHKGIESDVAGDADLLFAPNIEVANVLYKSLTYFGGATAASVTLGAAAPVVLTSRADSHKSKMLSIALASAY